MPGPLTVLGQVAEVAGKAIDFAKVREARANAPEMQQNAAARTDAEIKDDANRAVADDDLDEIRRRAAE